MIRSKNTILLLAVSCLISCNNQSRPSPVPRDTNVWSSPEIPNRPSIGKTAYAKGIIAQMSTAQKVGQLIMADVNTYSPKDFLEYPIGAVLAGGNSAPDKTHHASMEEWLAYADALFIESQSYPSPVKVPALFAIDAVHGHNNVEGAVIFPHNISLGAANDPTLMQEIGIATAQALVATGHDWTFAPTVAVAKNVQWGRTYESFSDDPALVKKLSHAMVIGLQSEHSDNPPILATAKHFIGDGGTTDGKDQGNTVLSERELAEQHAPGFYGALEAGVETIMASYSSWNGKKVHGAKYIVTDILKDKMRFTGLVVGDWDAHAQLEGCTASNCAKAINAGIDMLMAPTKWKELYQSLYASVESGEISEARLNDAVKRIIFAKIRSGILTAKVPSNRAGAGNFEAIAGQKVRAIARASVRKSQTLLKNESQTLPIKDVEKISVIGSGADDFSPQTGGWTLNWQGNFLSKEMFPNGDTLLEGLYQHTKNLGIELIFDPEDKQHSVPDLAIVVINEPSYAEFEGDVDSLALPSFNISSLKALKRLRKNNVPTVTILYSGRPMWVEEYLSNSDSFVSAWLPGTEGGGIADMLFGTTLNGIKVNFSGKSPFPWGKDNVTQPKSDDDLLFPRGFGLSTEVHAN